MPTPHSLDPDCPLHYFHECINNTHNINNMTLLFALCCLLLAPARAGSVQAVASRSASRLAQQDPDELLTKAESAVGTAMSAIKRNERALSAAGGIALMTCSRHLTLSLLFMQSFRTVGWPTVRDGLAELGDSYRAARAEFKDQLPTLRKARTLLPQLKQDVEEARALLATAASQSSALAKQSGAAEKALAKYAGKVSAADGKASAPKNVDELKAGLEEAKKAKASVEKALSEAAKKQEAAVAKYAALRSRYNELAKVQNSVQAVSDALDPAKLERVLGGMAAGALSCVASATSPLASSALLGGAIGKLVSERALPIVEAARERIADGPRLPPDVAAKVPGSVTRWVDTATKSVCGGASMWFAYRARALALTCSGALLGARLLTGSVSSALEARTGRRLSDLALDASGLYRRLDALDGTVDGKVGGEDGISVSALPLNAEAGLELVLAAAAIASQVGGGGVGGGVPALAKVLLSPLLAFEAYLKALSVGKALPR